VIFMMTDTSILRSVDNGHIWTEMHSKFNEAIQKSKHSGDYGRIIKIVQSKAENQFTYYLGDKEFSFYSNNCGDTVHLIKHEKGMIDIKTSADSQY